MKKILNLVVFVFLFSFIYISPVSASSHESHSHSEADALGILYVPCEGTGQKHLMTGRGIGQVPMKNGTVYEKGLFQCKGCSLGIVMATYPYAIPKASAPGQYVSVTLPNQVGAGYDFTKKGKTYSFSSASSWNTGFFANISFVGS